jgi:hypothetical protein
VDQYLDLVNRQLPEAAKHDSRYPVRFNHCFARIVLDTLCGGEWYQYIQKPAYRHMTERQLQEAIALCHQFLADRECSAHDASRP